LFSREYAQALDSTIFDMEAEDARELERQLERDPFAWTRRLRLLAYYGRADQVNRPESAARYKYHVLWLIQHQPDSEILASPHARLEAGTLSSAEEERAESLWERALAANPHKAKVFWNAAQHFVGRNEDARINFLREALRLDPDNWHYGLAIGMRLASDAVDALRAGGDPGYAWRELERSRNPAVLEPAVRLLQSEYNRWLMLGSEKPVFRDRAQQLFAKLKTVHPGLDETWVMPQIRPDMKNMLHRPPPSPEEQEQRLAALRPGVRRLRVEDFPELPPTVAAVLRKRGCTIPQPGKDDRRNVIQGEFFEAGRSGWAVLCSARGKSSVLVFRDGEDAGPEEIAQSEDDAYLVDTGQGWTSYSREITAADRKFILRHYRAYGGPEPPPIDHHGVDDSFLEKASITWYRYRGKWMQLQGAD
jgi:hypothetical protein